MSANIFFSILFQHVNITLTQRTSLCRTKQSAVFVFVFFFDLYIYRVQKRAEAALAPYTTPKDEDEDAVL